MNQVNLAQKLKVGVDAARNGDKATARTLLREVVQAEPDNELAWMWLASAVNTVAERRECLREALRINPANARAREALSRLGGAVGATTPAVPVAHVEAASGMARTLPILVGGLVVMALLTTLIFALVSNQQSAEPDRDTFEAILNPSATPTVDPNTFTATPSPFMVIVTVDVTLPPTFTPTFTPMPSQTPEPTATPYPLADFVMLYTRLNDGGQTAELYQAQGDGSASQRQTDNVQDVVFDPSGERIAFVRLVAASADAPASDIVELFVAPAANPAAAVQVSEFGGRISRPTWASNGVQLAFVSDYSGNEDIWTLTDDGLNIAQLTDHEAIDRDPTWSPDGNRIVFVSDRDSPGITRLFSMAADGSDVQRLNDMPGNTYQPRWSNNGRWLVFVNDGSGDGDIYIADADGQSSLLLTADDGGAEDLYPVFTPDDRWVVFLSNRGGDGIFRLYMVDLRGSVLVEMGEVTGDIQSVDFKPELLLRLLGN